MNERMRENCRCPQNQTAFLVSDGIGIGIGIGRECALWSPSLPNQIMDFEVVHVKIRVSVVYEGFSRPPARLRRSNTKIGGAICLRLCAAGVSMAQIHASCSS